jgi:hypothetical protein
VSGALKSEQSEGSCPPLMLLVTWQVQVIAGTHVPFWHLSIPVNGPFPVVGVHR